MTTRPVKPSPILPPGSAEARTVADRPGSENRAFGRTMAEALSSIESVRPSSPQAKRQLEAIRTMARMELMDLNTMLIRGLGGGTPSGGASGLSENLTEWLQVLMQLQGQNERTEAGARPRPSEKAPRTPSEVPTESRNFDDLIDQTAREHGLDPNLVRAVVKAESNFDPSAVSKAGAMGLMQLMPGTAKDLGVGDPFNPVENVSGGTRYLRDMLDRYSGDLDRALAAYNWGPGNLDRSRGGLPDETRNYIAVVNRYYRRFTDDEPA